ncbi:MBOAT-2 domain-containing protein [Mycena indigotica]|uniref:MBOAT-2 domain-containing protein n=1 Tax=Mycena indigotica TaxID=2126181 RepID=A0A8H6TAK2_9AGAR|nr:MBOAT-2 domain-containing protein [Mycena indigotica]KAF7312355.1 MBOAT-2 domain-containing protein [Mycena indigotica]
MVSASGDSLLDLGHRQPLSWSNLFTVFLPPALLYYLTNVLALLGPKTFVARLALLPVTLGFAIRAAVSLDVARGLLPTNPGGLEYLNQFLALAMHTASTRSFLRTFAATPTRLNHQSTNLYADALDLTFNLRGVGWSFSSNMQLPVEYRPLTSRSIFLVSVLKSLASHILAFDFFHYIAQSLGPDHVGSTAGFSIFDPSLQNPLTRHLNASTLTLLVGICIYAAVEIGHQVLTLIHVGVFRISPSECPPLFDSPWYATSLTDFWAVRWHQVFRQEFIGVGGKPLSLIFGRIGLVFGAFLVSGILHFVGLWGMNKGADTRIIFFFLTMGLGILVEGLWKSVSGWRVCGVAGWLWTASWLIGFGFLMTDPWCQSGLIGSVFIPHEYRPAVLLHRLLVTTT